MCPTATIYLRKLCDEAELVVLVEGIGVEEQGHQLAGHSGALGGGRGGGDDGSAKHTTQFGK